MHKNRLIFEITDVQTYDGYKRSEYPLRFEYKGIVYRISEILDRWYEASTIAGRPTYDYFKVRTGKGQIFILRHNRMYDVWSVLLNESSD